MHIDAPNHSRGAKSIDEFAMGTFVGRLRLFDFWHKTWAPLGRAEFEGKASGLVVTVCWLSGSDLAR
jgi:kynurenine formamidase